MEKGKKKGWEGKIRERNEVRKGRERRRERKRIEGGGIWGKKKKVCKKKQKVLRLLLGRTNFLSHVSNLLYH